MEKIEVECTKAHTYDAVFRNVGDVYHVKRRHIVVLEALKRVKRIESDSVVVALPLRKSVPAIAARTDDSNNDVNVVSVDDPEAVRKALRAEYKELFGKDAHGRTSIEKLRAEIEAKKAEDNG